MRKYNRILALTIIMIFVAWSLAACLPQTARRPMPYDTNNYNNYNTGMGTPYTAQGSQRYEGTSGMMTGNQTSSLFSKLDYSYATILENINMRSGPSASSPTTGNLKKGDAVKVIGKLNGWYIVNIPNTNKVGSISPKYAKLYSAQPATTTPGTTKPIPATNAKAQGAVTDGKTPTGTGTLSSQGSRILQLVNGERTKVGAKPLASNADLNKLATMKSQDMVEKNYFSHQSPTYGSPFDMMKTYGVSYMYAGENLAINSDADRVFQAWMNSEGHKKNILNPDFTEIGIGLYPKGSGSYTYTQMFIGK